MAQPNPTMLQLQRMYSGLDNNLNYVPRHTISNKYNAYKAADTAAGDASTAYRRQAEASKVPRPHDPNNRPTGPVDRKYFHQAGHQALQPLAGTASTTAGFHAERRESFNTKYEPVLRAKGEYQGHVEQADNARRSERKYASYQQLHQQWGK